MKKSTTSVFSRLAIAFLIICMAASLFTATAAAPASAVVAESTSTRTVSPFGVCAHMLWGYTNADIDKELDAAASAGTSWLRIDVSWRDIETADNAYNSTVLTKLDYVIAAAAKRNIKVMAVVMEIPDWANGTKGMWVPPTNDAKFGEFMKYMAAKYSSRITYWEIGNEVNEVDFWAVARAASPARYTSFLKAGYAGVKSGNANAKVISAGLAGSDDQYLQEMYNAGAKGYFDIVGVHPYTRGRSPYAVDATTPSSTFDGMKILKATMDRNGDSNLKIWATESGWHTSSTGYFVTQAQQAQNIYDAYKRITEEFPYVEAAFIYNIRDNGTSSTSTTDNFGMMKRDYTKKPAYASYRKAYQDFWVAAQVVTPPVTTVPTTPVTPPVTTVPTVPVTPPVTAEPTTPVTPPVTTVPTPTITPTPSVEPTAPTAPTPRKPRRTKVVVKTTYQGHALRNATVSFSKQGSSTTYHVHTNSKGYAVKSIPTGSYRMRVSYRGHTRISRSYSLGKAYYKLSAKVSSIR